MKIEPMVFSPGALVVFIIILGLVVLKILGVI